MAAYPASAGPMEVPLDPLIVANLKVVDVAAGPTEVGGKGARRNFVRRELSKERQKRGRLLFMERMEADVASRRAMSQVCTLRQNMENRAALDKIVDQMRPQSAQEGPLIVTHDRRLLYHGQDRKLDWHPLEYY
mmetsp:Transcript_92202/g.269795  ORF Transcript_92202/g.269795 Transcript_92202/m.269795 type:complete len:134 (+) Transcript_92202:76-477(+)